MKKHKHLVLAFLIVCSGLLIGSTAFAQVRGLYPAGMSATNSGLAPAPGLSYINYFSYYSFGKLKGPNGGTITDNLDAGIFIDQNIFMYVSKYKLLGANFAAVADLPFMNASLTLADQPIGVSNGYGETFIQPFMLSWQRDRYGLIAALGFMLDTGPAGAGYGGTTLSFGDTFYLTKNKAISASSYQIWEFHTEKDNNVKPGQTFSIDYSLMMTLPIQKDFKSLLQFGLTGYGQYQVSDNSGSGVGPILGNINYKVNAIGFGMNVILPPKGVTVGLKYFHEYGAESTVEGQNVQISAAVTF